MIELVPEMIARLPGRYSPRILHIFAGKSTMFECSDDGIARSEVPPGLEVEFNHADQTVIASNVVFLFNETPFNKHLGMRSSEAIGSLCHQ